MPATASRTRTLANGSLRLSRTDAKKRVLATLREHPGGLTVVDMAARFPRHGHAIRGAVAELVAAGVVRERPVIVRDRSGRPRIGMGLFVVPDVVEGLRLARCPAFSGAELREHRTRLGITVEALAGELRVTPAAVRYWQGAETVPAARREAILSALATLNTASRRGQKVENVRVLSALRALRRRAGWTQAILAAQLGVSQSTVSNWERGSGLSIACAARIVAALRAAPPATRITPADLRRARNGLTQRELAARLDVSLPTLRRWESGRVAVPRHRREALRRILTEHGDSVAISESFAEISAP